MYSKLRVSLSRRKLERLIIAVGMGLMLATIWIRLGTNTDRINDRLSVQ